MFSKSKTLFIILSMALFASCSESTTSPNPDSEKEEEEPVATTGTLEVTTTTSGNGTDEDGYSVTLDSNSQPIDINETITFTDIEEGSYSVELSGLGSGCTIDGDNPVSVDITAGETATIDFSVTCEESTAKGLLAFSQRVDGTFEIFTMQADGSELQQITDSGNESSHVDISPDGTKIVFQRQDPVTTKHDIWVMDIDGGNPTQLTSEQVSDRHPSWSPDGSQIAFETDRDGNFNIYVMDADGSNPTPLTSNDAHDIQPTWAPEGDRIAFIADDDGNGIIDIFAINTDGTGLEKLVEAGNSTGINLFDPSWSPDASQIAYQGYRSNGGAAIYIADLSDNSAEMITGSEVSAYQPTWSPDGSYIAFTDLATANTTDAIWIIKTDGTGALKLTDNEGTYSAFADWGINQN